jgi:hypothetical protein
MKAVDSLSAVSEQVHADATVGSYSGLGSERQLTFPREKVLSEPNRDDADHTNVCRGNGTSNALRIKLGQFLLSSPTLPDAQEFFQAMQKWEGHVIEVGRDTFSARVVPIVGEGPDQEAEIYIQEVSPDDRVLIEPGAVFYWSIGYLDRPSGRLRASVLRFRRLPVWSKRELESVRDKANKLRDLLDAD